MKRHLPPVQVCRPLLHRRGTSLIELMVVVSVLSVVAGSSCVLIANMIQTNRNQSGTLIRRRAMHLWQTHFLQDGRLAQSARIDSGTPEAHRVEFQLPEGKTVSYQVIADGLERHVDGKLAGRWETGRGTWEFSLREKERIARAEFHRPVASPLQVTGTMPGDPSRSTPGVDTCVDVALATGSFPLLTPGAP